MAKKGRPLKYKTAEELENAIEHFFKSCTGELMTDEDGELVINKYGYPCYIKPPIPPTITGLALAIGFNSRQALLNYQGKSEFNDTITRAKTYIESYAESRLYDKDGARGAMFYLTVNSKWNERSENESDDDGMTINIVRTPKKTPEDD